MAKSMPGARHTPSRKLLLGNGRRLICLFLWGLLILAPPVYSQNHTSQTTPAATSVQDGQLIAIGDQLVFIGSTGEELFCCLVASGGTIEKLELSYFGLYTEEAVNEVFNYMPASELKDVRIILQDIDGDGNQEAICQFSFNYQTDETKQANFVEADDTEPWTWLASGQMILILSLQQKKTLIGFTRLAHTLREYSQDPFDSLITSITMQTEGLPLEKWGSSVRLAYRYHSQVLPSRDEDEASKSTESYRSTIQVNLSRAEWEVTEREEKRE